MDRFAPAAFVTELEPQKPVHFFCTPTYLKISEKSKMSLLSLSKHFWLNIQVNNTFILHYFLKKW